MDDKVKSYSIKYVLPCDKEVERYANIKKKYWFSKKLLLFYCHFSYDEILKQNYMKKRWHLEIFIG